MRVNDMERVTLVRAALADAPELWRMQTAAFAEMLERYRDYDTSPGSEPLSKTETRLEQPFSFFYYIMLEGRKVGAIRVVDKHSDEPKRISPIFIMPEYRGKGIGGAALAAAEAIHGEHGWTLVTILQETGDLRFYEHHGYLRVQEEPIVVNERLSLVPYKK